MNIVILTGRFTRDPEIRYSQGEKSMAIARFTLAVDKNYKKQGDTANFINCTAFGKIAEIAEKYCAKGTKVSVMGEWMTGNYKNKDGNTVYTNDCNISKLEFCESKSQQNNENPQPMPSNDNSFMSIPDGIGDELPFA